MKRTLLLGLLLLASICNAQFYTDMDTTRPAKIVDRFKSYNDTITYFFNYEWYIPAKTSVTGNLGVGYANLVMTGTLPYARPALEFPDGTNACFPLTWLSDINMLRPDTLYGRIYYRGTTDTGHIALRTYYATTDSLGIIPSSGWDSITTILTVRADSIREETYFVIPNNFMKARSFNFFTMRRIADHPQDNLPTSIYIGRFSLWYWRII